MPYKSATPGTPRIPDVKTVMGLIPTCTGTPCKDINSFTKKTKAIPTTTRTKKFTIIRTPFSAIQFPSLSSLFHVYPGFWYFIPESRHTIAKQEIIKRLTEVALCSYFTAAGQNTKITIPLSPARRQAACSRRSSWQNER